MSSKDGTVWIEDRAYIDAGIIASELQGKCDAQQKEIERLHALLASRVAVEASPVAAGKGAAQTPP